MRAFWRRKVDLPPILGPVTSHRAPPDEIGVVGDEELALGFDVALDHRMAAAHDGEVAELVDGGADESCGSPRDAQARR